MQITVNGAPHQAAPGTTLAQLLAELELPVQAVAVAVNLEVVPRATHAERRLADGDAVEVVRAVGGG